MPVPTALRERTRRLVSLAPSRVDHIPALRIAVGLAVPLAVLLATGHVDWTMYASFGAFTGIYSRYEPTALRFRRQSVMALMLTVCIGLGATLASLGPMLGEHGLPWTAVVLGALVAAVSATVIERLGIKPAGALFPLFAVAGISAAPAAAGVGTALLIAGSTGAWCVLLGLAGHYLGERHPGAGVAPPRQAFSRAQLLRLAAVFLVTALGAGAIGILSGLPFPYWAQVAAVAPLSAPGHGDQVERGVHRLLGTILGVGVAAFLLSFPAEPWQLAVWVVVMQFLAELYVLRNYAFALCFITPLALLMVQLAHPQPVGPLLHARVVETAIGVGVGVVVVLAAAAMRRRARA